MSFFKRLFGGEKVLNEADYSVLKTDVHSHFIPGIDDGAKTLEDSIELIKGMQALGYKKVITTPHVMSDYYKNTPDIILGGLETVKAELRKQNIDIEIEAAAEYNVDSEFEPKILEKKLLTFGDNYVLFEMPFSEEPSNLKNCIFSMQTNGYKPILAHVERYAFWHGNWEKIESMKDRGVKLQLNINSLSGQYGPGVKKMAKELIDRDWIDLLGSDCHHVGHINLMKRVSTMPYLHKILKSGKLINSKL